MGNFLRLVSAVWSLDCRLRSAEKIRVSIVSIVDIALVLVAPFSLLFGADWTLSTGVALLVSSGFPAFGTALPRKKNSPRALPNKNIYKTKLRRNLNALPAKFEKLRYFYKFFCCFKNKIGVTPKNSRMSSERDGLTKKSPFYRENKDLPICFLPKHLSARPFA